MDKAYYRYIRNLERLQSCDCILHSHMAWVRWRILRRQCQKVSFNGNGYWRQKVGAPSKGIEDRSTATVLSVKEARTTGETKFKADPGKEWVLTG